MKHINALYIQSHANVVFNNLTTIEALPGVVRNRRKGAHISEHGNKGQILRGTKTILGTGKIKQIFDFWGISKFI